MTVCVTNGITISADTQIDDDGSKGKAPKIFKTNKAIIGIAGEYKHALRFVKWYNDRRRKKPGPDDNFEAIVYTSKYGLSYWDSDLEPQPIHDEVYAIGSGREAALGAMAVGASPEEAAEAACKVNTYCGLPIDSIRLEL